MWCEPGAIFLRCVHCGKRSHGWELDGKQQTPLPTPRARTLAKANTRVIPFGRVASR